jgi:acyl phosphate:glycerol-3-phosphate acyltransferase
MSMWGQAFGDGLGDWLGRWPVAGLVALLVGYVLGSLPTAIWVCRFFFKVDITQVGSKNPGMTNVWRTLGWRPALPVAIMDAAKGFFAAWLGLRLGEPSGHPEAMALVGGVAAVVGHSLSFLAGFKGGKSVLTAFGVFLAITPAASLSTFAIWGLVMWRSRIVSVASLASALVLSPLIVLESHWHGLPGLSPVFFVSLAVSLWVIWRHRANIRRIMQGTESRFNRSPS